MSFAWQNRLRLVLALFMFLIASPLASAMETGTPPPEPPIEEPAPPAETPPTSVPTVEPDPTEIPPTEVPTTAPDPTVAPTEEPEPTAPPTEEPTPDPTAAPTNEPEPTATEKITPTETATETPAASAQKRSSEPDMGALQSESALVAIVQQCEDDTRIGEFEFLPINLFAATSNTGQNCQELDPSLSGSITVTQDPDLGIPAYTTPFSGPDSFALVGPVPSGTFTVSITIGEHSDTSAELTLAPESPLLLPITYFVAESVPEEPVEGQGSVSVTQLLCEDTQRAGTSHFQIGSILAAQSTTTNCVLAPDTASGGFILTDPDNEDWVIGPNLPVDGVTRFDTLPSGSYQLTDASTNSISKPFNVSDGVNQSILVTTYVNQLPGTSTDVYIEKIWCEDDDRAGSTEFTLDTPRAFGPLADSATCYATPPGEQPELTVTINNVDTGYSDRITFEWGWGQFYDVPAGTYTVTESVEGLDPVESGPMYISGPTEPRIRIINYIPETGLPEPGEGGVGSLYGQVLHCSASDREAGGVDFIIDKGTIQLQAVTECDVVPNATANFTLYEVDEDTQEIIPGSGIPVEMDAPALLWLDNIPTGHYALAYISPTDGNEVLSHTFVVQPGSTTEIEINIFSAPEYLGSVKVWKDFCVDPDRAGEASFSVISEFGSQGPIPQMATTAATDCRYSDDGDGPFSWTLTNVDSGRTWTSDSREPEFGDIPAGSYTLTETWNGSTYTSDPFSFDPSRENIQVYVRNYIAEHDWVPDENEGTPYLDIRAYICANPDRDGGDEFFIFGDPNDQSGTGEGANNETSRCRPAVLTDGLTFTAIPEDGDGEPIGFVPREDGWFEADTGNGQVPAGEYTVTESTTGASTGLIRVTSGTYIEFYRYEPVPRADVTVHVTSAEPDIASTLPDDASWTVTLEDDTPVGGDTFDPDHLQLPQDIEVTDPVPYGTYVITVDAGPTFEPFTQSFTVEQPKQTVNVVLEPVTEASVTVNISSADPDIANTLPDDATWTVSQNGTELFSDTFAAEHLALPQSIDVTNPVPFGTYEITVNAGPVFLTYTSLVTVDSLSETVDVVLVPVEAPAAPVELSITSADIGIADRLPEGSTWTITRVDNPEQTMTMAFADDQLDLPVTIPVDTQVPYGDYIVEIDAGPTFEPYSETFTVGDNDDVASSMARQGFFALQQAPVTFEIVLQPAPVDPTPEPTVTPVPTETPDPATPAPTDPATPDDPDEASTPTPAPGTTISSLPNTGQGTSGGGTGTLLMLATVSALIAIAGGIVVRNQRT